MSPAALMTAMAPYLSIIRVFVLLAGAVSPATRGRLLQSVEADLRTEY
jgi:hypothetical protein